MASFSNIYQISCLTTILILVSIFFTQQIILYKNTRNGENGESGKNSQRVGENLNEISRNSPCKVTKVTKWPIWRKICHEFGEYSNLIAKRGPLESGDFNENGNSGKKANSLKVKWGKIGGHIYRTSLT